MGAEDFIVTGACARRGMNQDDGAKTMKMMQI
jgi:hypothetical protein